MNNNQTSYSPPGPLDRRVSYSDDTVIDLEEDDDPEQNSLFYSLEKKRDPKGVRYLLKG
jgi:hypothetical protein